MAEKSAREISTREIVELSETRKGTYVQVEAKLEPGFIPPSAALAPPAESVNVSAADTQQRTVQASQES